MCVRLFLLLRRAKLILPVTSSDAFSIQPLVNYAVAHGKDTTGEMQKASPRDTTLAEQVKVYHSDIKPRRQKTSEESLPPPFMEHIIRTHCLPRHRTRLL